MVKSGYQQTELGKIPEDWDVKTLGELAELKSGAGITSASISDEAEYPCFGGNGLRGFTYTKTHSGEFPLIGRQGAHCGNIQFASGEFFASEHAIVLTSKSKVVPLWLNYILTTRDLNRLSESSAQPGLSVTKLRGLTYPCPTDEDEQNAIAGALSDVDGLIAGLEALIAKKRSLKTATMQQLLTGKTRLPGFGEGVGMKQTELGEIPEDWDVKTLGELAELKSGAGITSASISDEAEYPCFGGNGLRGFTYTKTHSGEFPLIGRQGAHCGNIQFASGEFFASEHAIVLTSKPNVVPLWLNYILTTRDLNRLSESSAQPGLSVTKLRGLTYLYPTDEDEQKAIADIIQDIELDVDGIEARLQKVQALKQGMMQELLTGRTRLI